MNLPEQQRRQQLQESLESYRGREALYRDGSRFCLVRVDDFEPTDEGLAAQVTLIPTVGLDNQWISPWPVYSSWKNLKDAEDLWVSPWVSMKMYFDEGLIGAIVRWSESYPCETYDNDRFDQIVEQIQKYRKARLARQLVGVIKLWFNKKLIGTVSEHFMDGETDVHGQFAGEELDDDLKRALNNYRAWWEESWTREDCDPAPDGIYTGDWWIESESGTCFHCSIPIIDFNQHSIILRQVRGKPSRI